MGECGKWPWAVPSVHTVTEESSSVESPSVVFLGYYVDNSCECEHVSYRLLSVIGLKIDVSTFLCPEINFNGRNCRPAIIHIFSLSDCCCHPVVLFVVLLFSSFFCVVAWESLLTPVFTALSIGAVSDVVMRQNSPGECFFCLLMFLYLKYPCIS